MRRGLAVLLPLLLLSSVGFAVYALRIDEIRVTGLETLSPRAVVEASELRPGDRILWVRLTAAERRVEGIPVVASATAERRLPQTVVIDIREREPLVRLDGRPEMGADETGRLFEVASDRSLPVLAGWQGQGEPGEALDRGSRIVLASFARFGGGWRRLAQRIELGPALTIRLDDGTEVRFGPPDDLEAKGAAALAVLQATEPGELAYIDVRSPTIPVSAPRDAGHQEPEVEE